MLFQEGSCTLRDFVPFLVEDRKSTRYRSILVPSVRTNLERYLVSLLFNTAKPKPKGQVLENFAVDTWYLRDVLGDRAVKWWNEYDIISNSKSTAERMFALVFETGFQHTLMPDLFILGEDKFNQ